MRVLIFLHVFLFFPDDSLMIGMTKKMEYGSHLRFQIQHTKDHGSARCFKPHIESWNSILLLLFFIIGIFAMLQRIKNPNYKGKWKTPWIDNPGTFLCSSAVLDG